MSQKYLNIAAYEFIDIENIENLQQQLLSFCQSQYIKGSILLATEGVNLYLSASEDSINNFKDYLNNLLHISNISYKESWTEFQPFRRMLVKIKNEIITMKRDDIRPKEQAGPHISPQEFKKWLDENRDIYILDTRNDYEIEYGKFDQAQHLNVKSFVEFAEKSKNIDDAIKNKTVVMYCTGGIRCEKASALFIEQYGFKNVYQLEGGILKYFEECGGNHYTGDCFVFDDRICLDSKLQISKNEK